MILDQSELDVLTRRKFPSTSRPKLESWFERTDALLAAAEKAL